MEHVRKMNPVVLMEYAVVNNGELYDGFLNIKNRSDNYGIIWFWKEKGRRKK